jgi:hypothetical protein
MLIVEADASRKAEAPRHDALVRHGAGSVTLHKIDWMRWRISDCKPLPTQICDTQPH